MKKKIMYVMALVLVVSVLIACKSEPLIIKSPEAQEKIDQYRITLTKGEMFRDGKLIGKFIFQKEELDEMQRAQTVKMEFYVEGELMMKVTDSDGIIEIFKWSGERFKIVKNE